MVPRFTSGGDGGGVRAAAVRVVVAVVVAVPGEKSSP